MKRLTLALLAMSIVASAALAWECPLAATDKHRPKDRVCNGCLKQIAHAHGVEVPVMIVIPGQPIVQGVKLSLCCDCFRKVVVEGVSATMWVDMGRYGMQEYQKQHPPKTEAPAKAPPAPTPPTPSKKPGVVKKP